MEISFRFEVEGDFQSEKLWEDLKPTRVNVLDTISHVYVYGTVTPGVLTSIVIVCLSYGIVKGGEFVCE